MLLDLILDEDSDEVVHTFVLLLGLVLVDVELLAQETVPILLELGFGGLSDHLSFELDAVLVLAGHEVVQSGTGGTLEERGGRHDHITVVALLGGTSVGVDLDPFLDSVGQPDRS